MQYLMLQAIYEKAKVIALREERLLRIAATHEQKQICLFDLDRPQAVCDIYPLLPQDDFRVLIGQTDIKKAPEVRGKPAWSAVLGADPLPRQLLTHHRSFSPASKFGVICKHQGKFFAYKTRTDFTGNPQVPEALAQELGIQLEPIRFEALAKKQQTASGDAQV